MPPEIASLARRPLSKRVGSFKRSHPCPSCNHPPARRALRRQPPAYRSGQYNEAQLRREFIDPFFEASAGTLPTGRATPRPTRTSSTRTPSRSAAHPARRITAFRIGGTRKFFVEAKKPSVNIKDDVSPAFQLRRYAWSAKLPLSILTDFEEFAVYDCRAKPDRSDKASTGP